jgi:hypothetical protein
LREPTGVRYKEVVPAAAVNASFTTIRDVWPRATQGLGMSTRRDIRAIAPGAEAARPDAALYAARRIGGLLLLINP